MSICDSELTANCNECYEVSRADNDLTFVYGLTPSTQYYLWIEDKFKNIYKKLITSGVDGSFTIDPTDSTYPNGLFNPYAGEFYIFLSSDADGENVVNVTVYATEYSCVVLLISSASDISCTDPVANQCDPAYITDSDGSTIFEVASGESGTCTPCGTTTFNMIVNVDGNEQYNEVWDANDTNTINIK